MRIIKKNLLLIVIICFVSCKDKTDLGSNFFYLPDYESIDIGYPYGTIVYKSKEKNKFEKVLVYADIVSINNSDSYIIVKQNPNKKLLLQNIIDDLDDIKLWNNYYLESKKGGLVDLIYKKKSIYDIHKLIENKDIEVVADSLFKNDSFFKNIFKNKYNYYIIRKSDNSVFGPLTLSEFESMKNKMSIDLEFKN